MNSANYRRILLKVSGEMLAGEQGYGIQPSILEGLASEIASLVVQRIAARRALPAVRGR